MRFGDGNEVTEPVEVPSLDFDVEFLGARRE